MQDPAGHRSTGYGDFGFRVVSAMAWPWPESVAIDASGPRREVCAGFCRLSMRSDSALSASMIIMRARIRYRRLSASGLKLEYAMPGHGAFSRLAAEVPGGPRGCLHRSNTSMTIMRPPQHGHDGRKSAGSVWASSSGDGATFRSWRARARLASRAEPASRP